MRRQARFPPVLDRRFILDGPDGTGWEISLGEDLEILPSGGPVSFVEPAALVAVAAWADRIDRYGGEILISDAIKSKYAWNVGLLRALAGRTPYHTEVKHANAYFPLCRADGGLGLVELGANLGVFLNVPSEDARAALAYTVNEMARNASEHSQTKGSVFFAGGWFRTQGRVTFAVADAGIGIRGSLIKAGIIDSSHSDADAIDRAMQPHVTGALVGDENVAPDNAGLGLHVTRKIVQACSGSLLVHSFGAALHERASKASFLAAISPWQGTIVEVTIRPAQMPSFAPLFQSVVVRGEAQGEIHLNFTEGPREALVLSPPVDSTGFAADKDWFISRREECFDELQAGGYIELSFAKARYTTQSAVHGLLYEPIRKLGLPAVNRIWVSNAGSQVRAVLRQVVGYALDHHRGIIGVADSAT